jgi:hypothetical protein
MESCPAYCGFILGKAGGVIVGWIAVWILFEMVCDSFKMKRIIYFAVLGDELGARDRPDPLGRGAGGGFGQPPDITVKFHLFFSSYIGKFAIG